MEGFDLLTSVEDVIVFIYAAGHVCLATLGILLGWQK